MDDDDLAFDFEGTLEKETANYQGASVSDGGGIWGGRRGRRPPRSVPRRETCACAVDGAAGGRAPTTPPSSSLPRPAPAAPSRTSRPAPSSASRSPTLKKTTARSEEGGGRGGRERETSPEPNHAPPPPTPFLQTVCTYWLKGLCMKGDSCGFLHQFDRERMPVCRTMVRRGVCTEPDCPFKHTTEDIKECNMYRLGFCVYGPTCRYKHTRLERGMLPDPSSIEAARPREVRNVNAVVNSVNIAITAPRSERNKLLKERAKMGLPQETTPGVAVPQLTAPPTGGGGGGMMGQGQGRR